MSEASIVQRAPDRRFIPYDLLVVVLAVALVSFLLVTMGIRAKADRVEEECQDRLLALAQAEQLYLVKNTRYTADLEALRPFLEESRRNMPFVCPITGNPFMARVQGDRYKIIAPGTDFFIETGDPSW